MDHTPPASRLADVALDLAVHAHDTRALKATFDRLESELAGTPADSPARGELAAMTAIAGALLQHAIRSDHSASENAVVLARLDQLKRDLDTASRSEWVALERIRIAQDLHDRVAQTLFGLGLTADWLITHVDQDEQLRPDLERLKHMASTGLRQVRESIFALSSGPVEAGQLRLAVTNLLKELESAGIVGHLRTFGDLQLLPPDVTDALYQIVREALVNVRRHSGASSVLVSIRVQPESVVAVVQDDGKGLPEDVRETFRKGGAHLGLRGMESRSERLGGTLTLLPGDECGLIVTAGIPLRGAARHA
ncbi:MAG TPA: histidine kinase [Symbiobacteriaceae bacterium]|jgi:signal transduction histidine kinase